MEQDGSGSVVMGESAPPITDDKVRVKCVCGYRWGTKTKLQYISCPNCRHTNKLEDAIRREKEHASSGGDK